MGFVPDTAEAPKKKGFVPDDEGTPWSDVPGNALEEIKAMADPKGVTRNLKNMVDPTGGLESAVTGSFDPMKERLNQGVESGKSLLNFGKDLATHPIETFKKQPIATASTVLPVLGSLGKATKLLPASEAGGISLSKTSRRFPSSIEEAGRTAPVAPEPLSLPPEANQILKAKPTAEFIGKQNMGEGFPPENLYNIKGKRGAETVSAETLKKMGIEIPPEPSGSLGKLADKIKGQIPKEVLDPMQEVNEYLTKQYGKVSEKPGFANTIGELLDRKARTMRLKEMGMSPGQARKIIEKFGEDKLLELSDVAKEKGITKPVLGYKVGENIEKLDKVSGEKIGSIRQLAAKRGAAHNPKALVDSIRQELDPIYLGKGVNSGQKGAYLKALEDIKASASTPDVLAQKITDLNNFSTKNKMTQATGAITDVANAASRANNNLIKSVLNPQEAEAYSSSLKDFGSAKLFKRFYGFKAGREFAGRSGVGSMIKNAYQWGMDTFGNKFVENVSDGLGKVLKKNPGMASNPKALMDEVLKQMADTLDEIGDEFVQ